MSAPAQAEAFAPAQPPSPKPTWRPSQRSPWSMAFIAVVGLLGVLSILWAWDLPPFGGSVETTDNAYIRGRTTVIAPQVSGYVSAVRVHDYEQVRAGQILVEIDDRIYRARVAQAKAAIAAQMAALANSDQAHASRSAALTGQTAGITNASAQLLRARADMARVDALVSQGAVSISVRDQTRAALAQAEAQVRQAEAGTEVARQDLRTVEVGRAGLQAQVDQARAQLQLAELDLEHTVIRAPESGQLGEVGVRLGQYVTNGTTLFSLVPVDRWVIANYRESQTAHMAPNQPASFTVDALGGMRFTGRVEYLSPATGSEFAVLKPDNATGNFVKVPQRIGVRVAPDPNQSDLSRLRPGMSVETRVYTGRGR